MTESTDAPATAAWTGPALAPDAKGCYGWPRACDHFDDLACTIAESMADPEFARAWRRYNAPGRDWSDRTPAPVKPALSGRRHGW